MYFSATSTGANLTNSPLSPAKLNGPLFKNQVQGKSSLNSPRNPSTSGCTPGTPVSSKEPLHIRIKRKQESSNHVTSGASALNPTSSNSLATPKNNSLATPKSAQKAYEVKNFSEFTEIGPNDDNPKRISLVSIVCDYLSAQHSLCKNPMVTCPEFNLLAHHKCPDPRPKQSAPWNLTSRMMSRQIFPPFGGPEGGKLDRKFVHSRFRPIRTFRCAEEPDTMENTFYSCAIMPPDDTFVLAGTYLGDVKMFNMKSGTEESTYNCHDSQVTNLQVIFLMYAIHNRFITFRSKKKK